MADRRLVTTPVAPRAHNVIAATADLRNLHHAWEIVHANDMEDGIATPSVLHFADGASERLAALAATLLDGSYTPSPLHAFDLVDQDHDTRELHIPAVRDRIVERAVVNVVTPIIDPWLSPWGSVALRATRRRVRVGG
jgi:CRISPR-associated protein Cas1